MGKKQLFVMAAVFSAALAAGCGGGSGEQASTGRARGRAPRELERRAAEGQNEYRALGLSFMVPESLAVIVDEDDEFVVGDAGWQKMAEDFRFEEPTGLMVVVHHERRANLSFLEGGILERLPETVMLGNKTFEQYVGRETLEYEQGEVHSAGYVLLGRTPVEGGDYLVCRINYIGESGEAAVRKVGEVAGSFMAVNPRDMTDEIPVTVGFDSMLSMRIPEGMRRNWNRTDFFRIQTYDFPYTHFAITTGRRTQEDIGRLLRLDPGDIEASRGNFSGYPVLVFRQDDGNAVTTRKLFEKCLPGGEPIFLTMCVQSQWLEEHGDAGVILGTLEFELPGDAGDCPEDILRPVREHFRMR